MKRSMENLPTIEAFYEEMKPHLEWLSQLAFNGIVNLGPGGLPRLVFAKADFDKIAVDNKGICRKPVLK